MNRGFDKNRTVAEFAGLLQAILPGFAGFNGYDRNARMFCQHVSGPAVELTVEYDDALRSVLADSDRADVSGRVDLGDSTAYIIPFSDEPHSMLGAFVLFMDSRESATYREMVRLLGPVVRNFQRELNLSFRLMVARRRLEVLSAEERLLHEVEKLVHLNEASDDTLSKIVSLCLDLLELEGVALYVPDKQIRVAVGNAPKPVELSLMLGELVEAFHDDANSVRFMATGVITAGDDSGIVKVPVLKDGKEPIGIIVLTGWENSSFSVHRRHRVGRYVAAHIAEVISRDYDALTGLMGWGLFERRFALFCQDPGKRPAVGYEHIALCFDIDRLHVINETLGFEKGDEMLVAFAGILNNVLGKQGVTRISSNTFAAILADTDIEKAFLVAEEIRGKFGKMEFSRGTKKERASVSIGIGPVGKDSTSASSALVLAQVACKAAKDRGRGRVEVYRMDDHSIIQRMDDIQLVGDIRSAIESGRLRVYAQPIVPLADANRINYFEVLVRLVDESGEHVLPAEFFSSAERYQLMEELDRCVITETMSQLADHRDGGAGSPLRVAINLSGQSLGSERFLPFVQEAINKYGIAPETLCFEITETVAIANLQRAQHFMHTLKKLGCHFSLDDFGTGLSSFSYLKLFPIGTLKIDGSFVSDISTNVVSQSVVAAISEVARVMELETVAECVPDEKALKLLHGLGVTYGQGFLLGEPELLGDALGRVAVSANRVTA